MPDRVIRLAFIRGIEMTQQFTANEVRDWERAYKGTGAAKVFDAFADLLEAQERAVPVAECGHSSTVEHRASNANVAGSSPAARSNSDAERLAEALRELVVACEEHDAMVSRIIGHPAGWNAQYLNSARQALAAHSAQAQPPAARVPGVSAQAHENAQAALAAQESPNG